MATGGRSETRRWALFAPVALALGILLYFELPREPAIWIGAALAAAAILLGFLAALQHSLIARFSLIACTLFAVGFSAAQYRAWSVAAPVWIQGAEVALSGRALALEQAADGAPRLLLDQIEISGRSASETPRRVRISLRGAAAGVPADKARMRLRPLLGARVTLTARLFPPPGPAEPGAFDYRRRAWFEGVGALGSAIDWPRPAGPAASRGLLDRFTSWIDARRRAIAERAREGAGGSSGDIAAALLVGDRSGIAPEALEALRSSNLAHLLAISGLHMGILCLTIFGLARLSLALFARAPLGLAPKKFAAVAALAAGAIYLLLAGGTVPTQRAYVMAAVAFGAILVDRPPVTLRAVALAAMIILMLRPESLFEAGFQLSFAATTAMVAIFQASGRLIRLRRERVAERHVSAWSVAVINGFAGVFVASVIAGLATAPFAAFAFNRLAPYGLIANLLAVPALGLWIMPMGLAAICLAPFGLDGPAFTAMALGIDYVLWVAHWVAGFDSAVAPVRAGGSWALALIALGGLSLCLWRSLPLRAAGGGAVLFGLALWGLEPRPDILVSEGGRRIGVMTAEGRAFDRKAEGDYAAELWLRRDGERPESAKGRQAFYRFDGGAIARTAGGLRVELTLERDPDLELLCLESRLIIAPRAALKAESSQGCVVLDRAELRRGAIAIIAEGREIKRIMRASDEAGARLWTGADTRKAR